MQTPDHSLRTSGQVHDHGLRQRASMAGLGVAVVMAAMACLGAAQANVSSSISSTATATIVEPSSASQQGLVEGATPVMSAALIASQVARASSTGLSSPPIVRAVVAQSRVGAESAAIDPAVSHANFVITGERDQSISVELPETLPLVRVGGDEIVTFATNSDLPDRRGNVRMASADGVLAFNVSGRIADGGDRVAGRYSGVLRVTAQYN